MLKQHDKSIGNKNLISTFFILIFIAFAVIILSVNSKLDDFEDLQIEIKMKFLEDKKNEVKNKIHNINVLIEEIDKKNIQKSKKFIKQFLEEINKNKHNIISIQKLSKDMIYYKELINKGVYYKHSKHFNEKNQKNISTVEYIVLNKTWQWVISTKINDDIINKEIDAWEEQLSDLIRDNIYVHISLLILFSIALLLVMYVVNQFSMKTISRCRESIKEREKDLKQEIHKLEQQLEDETEKFHESAKMMQKQSKMLALGEMLGNLSHQWRQPLDLISKNALDIKSKLEINKTVRDEDIEKLTKINNSADYLSKTVDDFRVFLKADSLKIDFIVAEMIEKALTINKTIIEKNNIKIVKELDQDITLHNLSFGLLQAIVNIICNAKDALKKIPNDDRYIFISTKNLENSVEITITDTGKGIPEDVIGNIFKPYFTTKQKTYGTGLGLHMAHNIIEQNMSGELTVKNKHTTYKSSTYLGASFTIVLDLNEKKEG